MANYYVTTGGSDGADGSIGTPWATLHHACSVVSGVGDVINVAAGSYTDNTQAVLAVGVKIAGADKATTTISTTANPYILASSSVPTVDGSNEISGIGFSGANTCIQSRGRNNQKIHDNAFTNFAMWLDISGKARSFISNCTGSETETAIHCDNDKELSIYPDTTDWATGVEIYNNTVTNSLLYPNIIKGALIHHNSIDNSSASRSAVGNTALYWNSVQFYNNTILMNEISYSCIALEVWHVDNNCLFHDNVSNGWFSFNFNNHGVNTPYSLQCYNNDFSSNLVSTGIKDAIEVAGWISNVRIYGNYITNTGANNPWSYGVHINGAGTMSNIIIDHNVFYKIVSSDVKILTTQTWSQPMDLDGVYIYNNVFEHAVGSDSNAILIENDGSHGDVDGVIVKNNLFMNMNHGVGFWPQPPVTISGNFFQYNMIDLTMTSYVDTANDNGSFTISNNITATPDILGTGSRWTNWYKPTPAGNLINAGVDVGLAFTGAAPDIGAFEYGDLTTLFVAVTL